MLISLIMAPFWLLLDLIISLMPVGESFALSIESLTKYISYALYMFGSEFFLTIIGAIVFWLSAQLIWAIIEWVYIKIPGVS